MLAIGLMSGTSLDGIDVVLCRIEGHGTNTQIECLDFLVHPIPSEIKSKIKQACRSENFTTRALCSLNFELGNLFAAAVRSIKERNHLSDEAIDFVATHGQTVYHLPNPAANEVKSTLQIGEAAVIAYQHNVKVIHNFRVMDVAAGGEGAPLVPFSEKILYGKPNKKIVLQNIGGIGNLTYLDGDTVLAFDTGPGNMMIDQAMLNLFGKTYDNDGQTARKGQVIQCLLDELMAHPFLEQFPPKSTGREAFGETLVEEILERYKNALPEDVICTLTQFTAASIHYHYRHYLPSLPDEVILGGGGAYNSTLKQMLMQLLPETAIKTQEDFGFSSDAKEALAFVILGNETLHGSPSNVTSVTGAKEDVILGSIIPKPITNKKELTQ
ncbi:anhydro-N-acetylmuramic acid kinase AnmK [Aerococcaceae bacterium NML190938]|nr:anhydro-N-acetylmuramic acid kinase AnmK [Aerococcaceae bacterium NML190938]